MAINEEELAENGGLSLKDIFNFIKKSALWMLVCIVAAVILTTAIYLPVRYIFPKTETTTVRLELLYKGKDLGLNPDGTIFDENSFISIDIVTNAVAMSKLPLNDEDSISAIQERLHVEPVSSEEYVKLREAADKGDEKAIEALRSYVFNAVKYDVKLVNDGSLPLTKTQSIIFMSNLVRAYQEDFKNTYSSATTFSEEFFTKNSVNFDYLDYYDAYITELDRIQNYLGTLDDTDPTFMSSNKYRFSDVLGLKSILSKSCVNFMAYVLESQVSLDATKARSNISHNLTQIGFTLDSLNERLTKLSEQILTIQKESTITTYVDGVQTKIEVATFPPKFYELQGERTALDASIAESTKQQSILADRLAKLTNPSDDPANPKKQEADKMLTEIRDDAKEIVSEANLVILEYLNKNYVQDKIRVLLDANYVRTRETIGPAIVYLVAAIIGAMAGMIVTQSLITKKRKAAALAAAEKKNTEKTNDPA